MRPDTTTAKNIGRNPLGFITIDSYHPDWSQTKGLQCSVEIARVLDGAEIADVSTLFRQKFPAVSDIPVRRLAVFRLTPTSVVFIDNGGDTGETRGGVEHHESLVYSVFRNLPEQEADIVTAQMDMLDVESGEIIVRQGTPADDFFIVQDGEVEVIHEHGGDVRTVAHLQRGQFFGEMAILRNMPRMATVRAVTRTRLLVMNKDTFRGLVAQSLATSDDFDQVIRSRLAELAQR
jgi:hypothetical protein